MGAVALRKESVDRNKRNDLQRNRHNTSLSARRAWIEIGLSFARKIRPVSLSARRAWIEICVISLNYKEVLVALRKESVDRNCRYPARCVGLLCRSPQGERG